MMKKSISKLLFRTFFIILAVLLLGLLLNKDVIIHQGINYKVHTVHMPLYLKILDFFDRHYNYKLLVQRIIHDANSQQEKALAILRWTNEFIHPLPRGLPVIDDHVWHIIVRRYGTSEQLQDVFTTLCNYAGLDAFFFRLRGKDKAHRLTVSFVKIDNKWTIFDAHKGTYFRTGDGKLATAEDLTRGEWIAESIKPMSKDLKNYYTGYFDGTLTMNFEESHRFSRANIQSPIKRLIYGIKK